MTPRTIATCVSLLLLGSLLPGCGPEKEPDSESKTHWSEGQQRALDDPMHYRPEMDRADISGGGTRDFDDDGFKKDMDSLFLK